MDFEHIIQLIETVSDSALSSFTLEEGETKLTLVTNRQPLEETIQSEAKSNPVQVSSMVISDEQTKTEPEKKTVSAKSSSKVIKSPLVGIFYNAPSPDAEPFVKAGMKVKKGQVVGIVEAMKLMNEIESDFDGEIDEVLVENEGMVEYGQPLFTVK